MEGVLSLLFLLSSVLAEAHNLLGGEEETALDVLWMGKAQLLDVIGRSERVVDGEMQERKIKWRWRYRGSGGREQ